jgi:hypothetical protein
MLDFEIYVTRELAPNSGPVAFVCSTQQSEPAGAGRCKKPSVREFLRPFDIGDLGLGPCHPIVPSVGWPFEDHIPTTRTKR